MAADSGAGRTVPTTASGQMEFRFEPRTVAVPVDGHHLLLGVK